MLSLIGLGLNEESYSKEAGRIISEADKVYIESYTVEFPYEIKELESQFKGKKFIPADREFVESLKIVEESKKQNVVLLVYGSPLVATTHISLIQEAKKSGIKIKVIHNASILDAVAETGLQPYKFGKLSSIPSFEANSYIDTVKDNLKINAHSLILIDIGMNFEEALEKLKKDNYKKKIKINKIIVCEHLGLKDSCVYFNTITNLKSKKIKRPFCIIIPADLHFIEKEVLENFK